MNELRKHYISTLKSQTILVYSYEKGEITERFNVRGSIFKITVNVFIKKLSLLSYTKTIPVVFRCGGIYGYHRKVGRYAVCKIIDSQTTTFFKIN